MIETMLVGLVLLMPLLWLMTALSEVHRAALAATAAVREAGFDAARADDMGAADLAVNDAVARAFADLNLDPSRARVEWQSSSGLDRGGNVEVRVEYPVSVIRAPFLGSVSGPSLSVNAAHVTRIDPFRSRP